MKYFWWTISAFVVLVLITLAHRFTVDKTIYTQLERSPAQHIDTAKRLELPKDANLETVFPYLPAPQP
ncbi:MAG: hypothetical protein U0517_04045 [Candidatus Andersenbacteria bacterium]